MEIPTANIAVDAPFSQKSVLEEAIFSYNLGARVGQDAIGEYEAHLRRNGANITTYQSHMDSLRAQNALLLGDRDYLKAMLSAGDERKPLLASAGQHYRESLRGNLQVILRYYLPEEVAPAVLPPGVTRADVGKLTLEQCRAGYQRLLEGLPQVRYDSDAEDRSDYQRYADRAMVRLTRIESAAK